MNKIVVTGGAGFIGSALVRYLIQQTDCEVLNIDKLTYASNLDSIACVKENPRYHFACVDITDQSQLQPLISTFHPTGVIHLAAESHVDRSINNPSPFIQTNVVGTYTLLEVLRHYYQNLNEAQKAQFRFLQVSTDEVYGDLNDHHNVFTEHTPYAPSSPYSASKAAADHLVRAWHRTYGLPVLLSHSSNNYGPFQHSEKLIPTIIERALAEQPIPLYGNGQQKRDWLYVEDHVNALYLILTQGKIGESYNIGGNNEYKNLEVAQLICTELDQLKPRKNQQRYADLITLVSDRLGHDQHYAIDSSKLAKQLGWKPTTPFLQALRSYLLSFIKVSSSY